MQVLISGQHSLQYGVSRKGQGNIIRTFFATQTYKLHLSVCHGGRVSIIIIMIDADLYGVRRAADINQSYFDINLSFIIKKPISIEKGIIYDLFISADIAVLVKAKTVRLILFVKLFC